MKKQIVFVAKAALAAIVGISCFTGCARQISSDVYAADHVGEASSSYPGIIISARNITVQDKERLQENGLGIVGGGIGGGLVGSQIGKGTGNNVAIIGGAIAGAVGGAFAEKALKTQDGVEYIVQLDNGELKTVVQGPQPSLDEGQAVYVIIGHKGRSRVVARRT
ncbi:MAG: hypothetical protein JSR46_03645 [Verrucomicrobia bacterium]|nr:hypothetical protein [Verrucomicrobiota bacterium]